MKPNQYKDVEKEYGIGGSSNFMKLEPGENIVRFVSEFEVRGIHQFKNEKGKFETHTCFGKQKGCIYCNADNKITVKYLSWVIDQKDHKIKLLEIGHTIFKQLGQYQDDPDYSFDSVPNYNIKIKKTGEGLSTEYQVIPSPKRYELDAKEEEEVMKLKPISEVIQAMKDKEMKSQGTEIKKEDDIPIVEDEINQGMEEDIDVKNIPF